MSGRVEWMLPEEEFERRATKRLSEFTATDAAFDGCVKAQRDLGAAATVCRKERATMMSFLMQGFCDSLFDTALRCQKKGPLETAGERCRAEQTTLITCANVYDQKLRMFRASRAPPSEPAAPPS